MLESLMTNPYAWAFLGACTIFSVVFGIWQWYKSKRKKELYNSKRWKKPFARFGT